MNRDGGTQALAWGLLALAALCQEDAEAARRLAALRNDDGSWDRNPYQTAVAMMAERGSL